MAETTIQKNIVVEKKVCTECKKELLFSAFHKNRRLKSGLNSSCIECRRQYRGKYYAKNHSRLVLYSKQYYESNKETVSKAGKVYREKNKNKILLARKLYRENNRELISKRKKIAYPKNREANILRCRKHAGKYPESNKLSTSARRAKLKKAKGKFTLKQWREKIAFWGHRCYLCKASLVNKTIQIEHRKPISRGGANWLSNVAPACSDCNKSKSNKTEKEFLEWRRNASTS